MSDKDGGPELDCKVISWYIPYKEESNHGMQVVCRDSCEETRSDVALQETLQVHANEGKR